MPLPREDAMTASPLIRLHPADNVLVAKSPLALGQDLPELGLRTRAQVPAGHKIAARRIAAGEAVRKYDTVIGSAARDIEAGDYVHTHNVALVIVCSKHLNRLGVLDVGACGGWPLAMGGDHLLVRTLVAPPSRELSDAEETDLLPHRGHRVPGTGAHRAPTLGGQPRHRVGAR